MRIEHSKVNIFAAYGLLLLISALLQTTMLAKITILGFTPTLYIAATVCVAMFEGEWTGAAFGLVLGYFVDATVGMHTGLTALSLLVAGIMVAVIARKFMLRRILSALVLYGIVHLTFFALILFFRVFVIADMAGFVGYSAARFMTVLLSAVYIPPYYFIARWLHFSFWGTEET